MKEILNTKTEKIRWIRLAVKIAVIAVILWLVFGIFFGLVRIQGVAMAPRLEDGDLTLYQRGNEGLKRDDVVLFEHDGRMYSSRILAVEGDKVSLDNDGIIYVNDEQASEQPVFLVEQGQEIVGSYPNYVPLGHVFLLNDNLNSLEDSRSFNNIEINAIKGRAISILRTRAV